MNSSASLMIAWESTKSSTKYLGNLDGIRLIITTHFHKLIELEKDKKFINLSVSALKKDGKFVFDYKI